MLFFLMMLLMKLSNVPDWVLPSPAMSADNVLPAHTGSSGDPTPQIKDGFIVEFC